jgi:hypothetical protein
MILAVSFGTVGLVVFFLSMLTLFAKAAGRGNRAVGALRWVLAIFYGLLVVAGIVGLCFSGWLMFAGGGRAAVLLIVTIPLSLIVMVMGVRLFGFVTTPVEAAAAPRTLQNSTGWGALTEASEKMRSGGVAAHLRPEALVRRGADDDVPGESRE